MRCDCCDRVLTDFEATLRHKKTGEFLNTCLKCLEGLDIKYTGRVELLTSKNTHLNEKYDEI
jgi:hypothetical protein